MNIDTRNVMRAIASLAIQKALLDIGQPAYGKVVNKLQKEYECYIPDCYEHPEYLENVLHSIFGNSASTIIQSIREQLLEHMHDTRIRTLVMKIGA